MSGRERTRRGFLGASIATGIGAAMRSSLPSRPPWRAASTTARPDDRARPVHAARAPGSVIKACTVYDKPWWRDKGLTGSSVSIDRLVSATFDNSPRTRWLTVTGIKRVLQTPEHYMTPRALGDADNCGPGVTRRQSPTDSTTPTASQRRTGTPSRKPPWPRRGRGVPIQAIDGHTPDRLVDILTAHEQAPEPERAAALGAAGAVWGADDRLRAPLYMTAAAALDAYGDPAVTPIASALSEVYERATRTGRPLDTPLLVVLDEVANVAQLPGLDALASTEAGQGIQLVTVAPRPRPAAIALHVIRQETGTAARPGNDITDRKDQTGDSARRRAAARVGCRTQWKRAGTWPATIRSPANRRRR